MVLVVVQTDDGLVGYGEALARYSLRSYVSLIEDLLAPIVIGQDPLTSNACGADGPRFHGQDRRHLLEASRPSTLRSGTSWARRRASQFKPRQHGARACGPYASSISWADGPGAWALAAGFHMIKIKIGPPVEKALARGEAHSRDRWRQRAALGGNYGFDFDDAVRVARSLADLGYYWFEPLPVKDDAGYHRLRTQIPIRLAAVKASIRFSAAGALARGSLGVIQPDVARSGGITETRRIAAVAYANVPFAPHIGFSGAVCVAATLQLCAAFPNFLTFECMISQSLREDSRR